MTLNGSNSFSATGTTNSSGVYTFTIIPAGGGYSVSATYGAATATVSGQTVSSGATTNVNVTIPTGSIAVTVQQNGTGLSGATVTLTGPASYSAVGTTNASGVYTFTNVPAGSGYTVSTSSAAATVQQTGVNVTSGSTTSLTLTIPIGSLKVTVKNSSTGCSLRSNQTVVVTGPGSFSVTGTTNASGVVTFTNIPAGTGYTAKTPANGSNGSGSVTITSGNQTTVTLSQNGSCP